MNFLEAVKAMKEGKKVRRPIYDYVVFLDEVGDIQANDGKKYIAKPCINIKAIEATDWEIVKEKKTLSDMIDDVNFPGRPKLDVEFIKVAIKGIKEDIEEKANKQMKGTSQMFIDGLRYVKEIIDKRVGEKLT